MTTTRTRGDNGVQHGDVVHTSETPTLDPGAHIMHHVVFDQTLAHEPDGAACIRILGPSTLSAVQALRLGQELIQLATHVGEVRSLLGADQ